jgi:hypothetical protein
MIIIKLFQASGTGVGEKFFEFGSNLDPRVPLPLGWFHGLGSGAAATILVYVWTLEVGSTTSVSLVSLIIAM